MTDSLPLSQHEEDVLLGDSVIRMARMLLSLAVAFISAYICCIGFWTFLLFSIIFALLMVIADLTLGTALHRKLPEAAVAKVGAAARVTRNFSSSFFSKKVAPQAV